MDVALVSSSRSPKASSPLSIGIDLSCLDTPFATGVERAAVRHALAWAESAHVTAFTTRIVDRELSLSLERSGVRIVHASALVPRPLWRRLFLGRVAASARVDLLVCPVAHAPSCRGLPVIRTVHDCPDAHPSTYDELSPSEGRGRRLSVLARSIPTVFVSEATRRDFMGLFPKFDAPSTVIGQIVDKRYFAVRSIEGRVSQKIGIVVGSMRGRRRPTIVDAAIEIVRRSIPEFRIVWIGPPPRKDFGLRRIESVFDVDDTALVERMSGADFVLLPSVLEGFGIVAAEAAAMECPVIAADSSAVREATGGHARFYDGESADALAAAILEHFAHPEIAAARAIEAKNFVRRFDAARIAQSYLDFFETLLGRK